MNPKAKEILLKKLGSRVSFEKADILVYGHDTGIMPRAIMSTIDHTPEAVVVARSLDDVRETLLTASEFAIPVTPRGQGSSGYGGAIPTRAGIVLDLTNMDRILEINTENQTVDVEPGVTWSHLSHELLKKGLDNRIYPTSAPSSTVAGWLSKGGVGIGSMKFGSISNVVLEADILGLDGAIRAYKKDEVETLHQTCGIMGVITRVRLVCKKAGDITPFSLAFADAGALQNFIMKSRVELEPYTIILHSPGYIQMKKMAGIKEDIPGNMFLATVGMEDAGAAVSEKLETLAVEFNGRMLGKHISEAEWDSRFYPMRIKKLGPDFVVSEFYIPDEKLSLLWRKIEADLSGDLLGMEAMVVDKNRIAVLIYILDNADQFFYLVRAAKAVRAIRIALRNGGSLYSSALWFASSSRAVLGSEKYDKVLKKKRKEDPGWLLNPGKIVPPRIKWFPIMDVCSFMTLGANFVAPLSKILRYKRPALKDR